LNFVCRHCHGAGLGNPKTDEELIQAATGYHLDTVIETTDTLVESTPEAP
jgi:hypothetical protein